jgi:hypothetical protein
MVAGHCSGFAGYWLLVSKPLPSMG